MKIPFPKNFEPQKPLKIYDYQDITIIILAKSLQVSQCNVSNLYQKGIIPPYWRLKEPIINKSYSFQVSFEEGLNITVEKGKVSFSMKNNVSKVSLEKIILQFINTYIGNNIFKIQIVFRRLITLPNGKKTGLNFIKDNTIKLPDNQLKVKNILPSKIQLNFIYQYQDSPFLISLIDTPVKKNNKMYSGLLFRGVINYDNKGRFNQKNNFEALKIITNYPLFLDFFNEVINEDFL